MARLWKTDLIENQSNLYNNYKIFVSQNYVFYLLSSEGLTYNSLRRKKDITFWQVMPSFLFLRTKK